MEIHLRDHTFILNTDQCSQIKGGYLATASLLAICLDESPVRYLYSGWQSWSLTSWVDLKHPMRPQRPTLMHPMQTDPAYAKEKRPHGSWYGAVEFQDGSILFIGALKLESHVMLDGQSLVGWYEGRQDEWFIAYGEEDEILARYASLLTETLGKSRAKKAQRVWCSWYSLYKEINEAALLKILEDMQDLPFDVFQVDDGWQMAWGQWEANDKFPSGMEALAKHIKATGRKAGLWLAPLLAVPASRLYQEHPEWLLHDEQGRLASAGFNWGNPLYAMDSTHPEALAWLAALMKQIRAWGYDYLKLDFLYAGALPGKRHENMPREAAYRHGLKVIREALGEATLLACGAPILPSIGLCDALRIGPDVAETWASELDDNLLMNFTTPGVRNALRTSMHRLWLAPLLQPDPDVVYFRSRMNNLSGEQKVLLQDLAEVCGFKATSDIPAWLTAEEKEALRTFLQNDARVERSGRTSFNIHGREVDFKPYISLPPAPGFFTNLRGMVAGVAGNSPILLRFIFKIWGRMTRKKITGESS